MITIRNLDVGTLRVNAGTGGALDGNSDLLNEIRSAIRSTPDEPTVVMAIKAQTNEIIANIRSIAGSGGFGGSTTGSTPHGIGADEELRRLIEQITKAVTALEGIGGEGGKGPSAGGEDSYFQRNVLFQRLNETTNLFGKLDSKILTLHKTLEAFGTLKDKQFEASISGLMSSLMGTALHATNLTSAFRNLHTATQQQLAALETSGAHGSNILGPMEFFFEGLTRVREGIFLTSDSFRTTIAGIKDTLQAGLMSPLAMTGKSAAELSVDFREARRGMRENQGFDTRGWMGTQEANASLTALVELQMKFGNQAQIKDIQTQQMAAQEGNYLKLIAASTGETVSKLGEQLRIATRQQDVLIGLGRLNEKETQNFAQGSEYLKTFGKAGAAISEQAAAMLKHGNTRNEAIASSQEVAKMAGASPAMFDALWRTIEQMRNPTGSTKAEQQESLRQAAAGMGRNAAGSEITGMSAPQQNLGPLAGILDRLAMLIVGGTMAAGKPAADAAQQAKQETDPAYAMIGRVKEYWEANVTPLLRLEAAIIAQTAATVFNSGALWALASKQGIGLGGILGGLGRVAGPIAGAAIGAGTAYASGSGTGGVIGAGAGSLVGGGIGAAIGTTLGPIGTMIGMAAGSALGGYLGERFGSSMDQPTPQAAATPQGVPQYVSPAAAAPAVPAPHNVFGPDPRSASSPGDTAQTLAYQDSTVNLLSKLIYSTEDGNSRLSQIHGELSRQTGYLGADAGAASGSAPPMGLGLRADVPSRSALSRPDSSTPFV